ncbi:MAG: hypothetical protein J3Q66DRAFT_368512 [Benniella sp.]|nr:MAG: hypothetical protein J3Q66DRAFT_368512 [Benniella sp.]
MPALTDKIFLPISIFILNVVLAAFKFILANAVGACFAIYAMRGCEYAKSVGWIRSAGYLEMIKTSYNTFKRKNAPGSVKLALIVAIMATLVANFLDKGISSLVTPGFRLGHQIQDLVVSPQVGYIGSFFGWRFVVPANGSVVSTMERALNSSIANPSPEDGYVYSPVTSEYTPVCTDFWFHFQGEIMRNGTGCGVGIHYRYTSNRTLIKTERSPNRWSIIVETSPLEPDDLINNQLIWGSLYSSDPNSLSWKGEACSVREDEQKSPCPKTLIRKCVLHNGNITVLATTITRFIGTIDRYDSDAANYFSTYHSDDLLSTMNETIRTKTIPARPGQASQNLMAEIRVANSTVDSLVCMAEGPDREEFVCVYITMTIHVFNQPVHNQIQFLIERFEGSPYFTPHMILEYFPDNMDALISTEKTRNDNVAVADYMARVGSSFFVDFKENKVYILYDKAELEAGLETPLWALIATGIITLVSLCVWQLTQWLVGPPHTSSLYSIIRTRLAETSGTPVPRLMRFKLPLMFEDVNLLPDQVENLRDDTETLPDETGTLPEDFKSEWVQDKEK